MSSSSFITLDVFSPNSLLLLGTCDSKLCVDTFLYTLNAWATNDEISPVLAGRINVLLVLAKCLKAEMYCSAKVNDAAFFPF